MNLNGTGVKYESQTLLTQGHPHHQTAKRGDVALFLRNHLNKYAQFSKSCIHLICVTHTHTPADDILVDFVVFVVVVD